MSHKNKPSGWDDVAHWYDGWVGKSGSDHHRKIAIPALVKILSIKHEQQVIDIGCGSGVLAPYIADASASYTGVDISKRLISTAKQYHGAHGKFLVGDARKLSYNIPANSFDAATFLLSIQDMNPLDDVLKQAHVLLRDDCILAILMTHPCFRIPRQSGWGFEQSKKLQYRRIDRYLTPLKIPMKQHKRGATISFHRPLSAYINTLAQCGFVVDKLDEITHEQGTSRAEKRASNEFPLFMALRARKI